MERYLHVLIIASAHFLIPVGCSSQLPCSPRSYGDSSVVCVCGENYCDTLDTLEDLDKDEVTVFESSKTGSRFQRVDLQVFELATRQEVIDLNVDTKYQSIIGFGAAFTDATGINVNSIPRNTIISDYFSSSGLDYSIGRVPIGGTDFSTREYTYDDLNKGETDFNLTNFKLQPEDIDYKIPLILAASKLQPNVKLFASAWSAPSWMKTNGALSGRGFLIGQPGNDYHKTWAQYYVKFLDTYGIEGIEFWSMTTGNEPANGYIPYFPFNCLGFSPSDMKEFIKLDLGPALEAAGYGPDRLKLILFDGQIPLLSMWADTVLTDENATRYISGLGTHWYWRSVSPSRIFDSIHDSYPDTFILSTEACHTKSIFEKEAVKLGNWERAEAYASDILSDLNHWVTGWTDWNMALDLEGGPNWAENYVDAPIIVNASSGEYYKQPMFYALAHFSKFLPPDSVRIQANVTNCGSYLQSVAFRRPDKAITLIVLNEYETQVGLTVRSSRIFNDTIAARSIKSFIWWE